jgi:hypothetical protein
VEFLFNSLKNLYHRGDDVVALGGIVNCTKEGEVPCHFPGVHQAERHAERLALRIPTCAQSPTCDASFRVRDVRR